MMFKNANQLVLTVLGVLLLAAAVMKGWQLLVEPVANKDIWSNRLFLIFMVECELALGIWLVSGLFRKAAWLAAVVCFGLFSAVTFYKGVSGADSCGCFGAVKIKPWVTLFLVDLPAVIGLVVFRCKDFRAVEVLRFWGLFWPGPAVGYLVCVFVLGVGVVGAAGGVLLLNEPAKETADYVVLEPESWVGKELPIIDNIDIGELLKSGSWLILFYHHDCPDCHKAIAELENTATSLDGNRDTHKVALIEVPPYGSIVLKHNQNYVIGKLSNMKEWFIATPAVILIDNSVVRYSFEGKVPDLNSVI